MVVIVEERRKINVFCTFYIKLDVVCICMEANWRIRDKVEKGNYVMLKSIGPRTDPWGTPCVTRREDERVE